MRYEVLTLIGGNWENCWKDTDEQGNETPTTFESYKAAQAEISEHRRDLKEANMKSWDRFKIQPIKECRLVELSEAFEQSSQGAWTSKRTTFTAEDTRFANAAHNCMPNLLEAVRLLRVVIGFDEDHPNPFNGQDEIIALQILSELGA